MESAHVRSCQRTALRLKSTPGNGVSSYCEILPACCSASENTHQGMEPPHVVELLLACSSASEEAHRGMKQAR
eukprot:1144553-Pelagomonas_calceolata.AAC.3